jgi:tetratricopeptide (TPR) repeat protein
MRRRKTVKNLLIGLFICTFLLTTCRGTSPTAQMTPVSTVVQTTSTPSPFPTPTRTLVPSATSTASVTPLPTIPTFTPTFDVSTIVTVTPAPKAECPRENPSVVAKFATPSSDGSYEIHYAPEILDYLNSGGIIEQLQDTGLEKIADITGDGVNEVGYGGFSIGYSIFGCKDGKYQDILHFAGDFGAELGDVLDLNENGMPEVILYNLVHYGYIDISVFEWDGNKYNSLIQIPSNYPTEFIDWVSATEYPKFMDIDKDGLKEIVLVFYRLCGGFGDFCDGTPRRQETTVLSWNGQNYVVQQNYYAPAQYRFQAIQDGDAAASQKEYDKAISLYQEAISSNMLKSYSLEISDNLRAQYDTQYGTTPTPTPHPIAVDEYPKLAAYAYYRILLIYLVQGYESDAGTVYNTLQQKFGNDPYARPYAEMATAFWEAYQSTQRMYDGCAAAIQYAVEHPEILTPLGSDYHGWQSHTYAPADVCPFR